MDCPSCGNQNREGAKFCDSCGAALAAGTAEQPTGPGDPTRATDPAPPPAQATSVPEGEVVAGRYRVGEVLGSDGRKDVVLAHDERTGREVALALHEMRDEGEAAIARARREMAAMEKLGEHPHVVAVLDTGEDGERQYVASEHMAGGDVRAMLNRSPEGHLDVAEAMRIAIDVCRALEHAHACGIVHRDIKPANIWLTSGGQARLGGFAVAATGPSRGRSLVGTAAFLPPEQAVGREAGPRSDLYSLGAVLYELVTGRPPFVASDAVSVIGQHLNAEPAPASSRNPQIPRALDDLISDLLAKDPAQRPESAAHVRVRLEKALEAPEPEPEESEAAKERDPLDSLTGGLFVGREQEVETLRAAADDALDGEARLLLVGGEPGIGKTRLCEEIATYVRLRGAKVHWGRCQEDEGAPAYWPWIQLIRSYVRDSDPVALAWELGADAPYIAQLVPEVAQRLGNVEAAEPGTDEAARFRLFDAVSRFLISASASRPLMLVLDDLHWADESSLLLLEFLANEMYDSSLLVVGTYRDVELGRHHPLGRVLGELSRAHGITRLTLHGLPAAQIARYIEQSIGITPPAELVSRLAEQTEGNPFFVSEVVRLLVSEGQLDWSGDGPLQIPQGVRDVVGRRLDRLSPEANSALTVAAALGRDVDPELLARVADCPPDQMEERLREAVRAQLLREDAPGEFSFAHALVRETLYGEISAAKRPSLHAKVAQALEVMERTGEGGISRRHLSEAARHFHLAGAAGEPAKAVAYAVRAGDSAMRNLGYEEAAEHYRRALDAQELCGPDPDRRLDLLLKLGDALFRGGDLEDAREVLVEAAELAQERERPELVARAALGAQACAPVGYFDHELAELAERSLEALPEGDSELRARLIVMLGQQLYWVDPQGKSRPLLEDAIAMARRLGDDRTLAEVLANSSFVWVGPDGPSIRLEMHREAQQLARRAHYPEVEIRAHALSMRDSLELGDVAASDAEFDVYLRLAEGLRMPQHLWHIPLLRGMRAIIDGRLTDAEEFLAAARAGGERVGEPLVDQFCSVQAVLLYRLQGRLGETTAQTAELARRFPAIPAWRMVSAITNAQLGDLGPARVELDRVAADDFAAVPRDLQWLVSITTLCEMASLLGDAERAARLHELLEPFNGLVSVAGRAAASWGPVSRYLALASAAAGEFDRAEREITESVKLSQRMGDRPFATMATVDLARILLRRGRSGDHERAMKLLDESLGTSQELGMSGLIDDALALKLGASGLDGLDAMASIGDVAEAVTEERPEIRHHAAPDGTVTILFSDIEDSTSMTERLGDERWIGLLRSHNAIFRDRLAAHDGIEVKNQGDGFMLVFSDPAAALRCAAEVQHALAERAAASPDEGIRVRMGMHTGTAIAEEGDFFGRNVILAARIAAAADGGEVLVSEEAHERTADAGLPFDEGRELDLKGLTGTHRVFRAIWEEAALPV